MNSNVQKSPLCQPLSARRRAFELIGKSLIYISAALVITLLIGLIGYIFYRGLPHLTWQLLSTARSASATARNASSTTTW